MSAEYCPNPDDKAKLTAQDCYQLRCSLIHSGSSDIAEKKIVDVATIQFFDNSMRAHLNYAGGNRLNGVLQPNVLQLNAEQFCNHMYDAVDKWDTEVASDSAIQREKSDQC